MFLSTVFLCRVLRCHYNLRMMTLGMHCDVYIQQHKLRFSIMDGAAAKCMTVICSHERVTVSNSQRIHSTYLLESLLVLVLNRVALRRSVQSAVTHLPGERWRFCCLQQHMQRRKGTRECQDPKIKKRIKPRTVHIRWCTLIRKPVHTNISVYSYKNNHPFTTDSFIYYHNGRRFNIY